EGLRATTPQSQQIASYTAQIASLQAQITFYEQTLTGTVPGTGLNELAIQFSNLQAEQRRRDVVLDASLKDHQSALSQANSQQIFLQRYVEPTRPESSVYPRDL